MTLPFFRQPARSLPARVGGAAILLVIGGALALATASWREGALFALGGAGGALLYATGFGFMGAWRDAIRRRDVAGVEAQIYLLGAGVILFAASLGRGVGFGGMALHGAMAPLGLAVALGGALFGGGLAFVGEGIALLAAIAAAVLGAWLAGLTPALWAALPSVGTFVLPALLGWKGAAPIQLGVLILLWTFARMWAGTTPQSPVRPLVAPSVALAVVGWAVLMVGGAPWHLVPLAAVGRMDLAVALGAVAAAAFAPRGGQRPPVGALAASAAGGLALGYGAGIAGSNLEGLVAAVASGSLAGWLWLAAAFAALALALRLRRA